MANVFDYMDYRQFLRDTYRENKARSPAYSYRFIAGKVGFRSASFFGQILKGSSNISLSMAARFAAFLKLKRKEADFFLALVMFNQSKGEEERKQGFERLLAFRGSRVRILGADEYAFYDKWYYTAVRELLWFEPFQGDYAALARRLSPPITAAEAEAAVALLLRLRMIARNSQGQYARTDGVSTSTGLAARAEAIRTFQLQTLALAGEAIDRFPRETRSLSTLTLSLSAKGFKAIEEELSGFRRLLLKIAEGDEREDTVYQINFQIFPLTRPRPGRSA
ncbi:MAG TPA: TIGR02147 family protein [Fibrobacteria bacterium]|nr:TIGR02147 family protein [Fibrobacteria bacterium]